MERLFATALFCSFTQLACSPSAPSQPREATAQRSLELPRAALKSSAPQQQPAQEEAVAPGTQASANIHTVSMPSSDSSLKTVEANLTAQPNQACNTVMSEQALCACLTRESGASELGACQMQTFATPEFATMTTPGGDSYGIGFYRKGWYKLSRLHVAGMEDFAVRKARVERAGDKRVVRIVTYTQLGELEWMHTGNELVLCPLTKPGMDNGGCSHYPLYAHTRTMVTEQASEQESRFRVELSDEGAHVRTRGGPLEHPELLAALGTHTLGE